MQIQPAPNGVWSGREPKPLTKKLNPIWWFGIEDDQTYQEANYHPEWPEWRRKLMWQYIRNPLMNFNSYVIGVQDRNYKVEVLHGHDDPNTYQRDDVGEKGWQISVLKFDNGVRLPWVSYSGKWEFNIGWHPSGSF